MLLQSLIRILEIFGPENGLSLIRIGDFWAPQGRKMRLGLSVFGDFEARFGDEYMLFR